MEYAKYYNASVIVDDMIKKGDVACYPTESDNKYKGIYVCKDINVFWVARILEGYNEEYEKEENKYLVERNRIDIFNVMYKLYELSKKKLPNFKEINSYSLSRTKCHEYIDDFTTENIIKAVILLDDRDGLCNWDYCETDSLWEAIDIIDGGYGIIDMV